jgi:hypothetical protein
MPVDLCNVPATFEQLMESILQGLRYEACLVYFDDVIVVGQTLVYISFLSFFHPYNYMTPFLESIYLFFLSHKQSYACIL